MNSKQLRFIFVVVALLFMSWLVLAQWREIRHMNWEIDPIALTATLPALVALFFLGALGWHLILCSLGVSPDLRSSTHTWLVSSLGRYVPGAIWGYVGRIGMSVESGIPATTVALALYLETLMLCGGAVAAGLPAAAAAVGFPMQWRSLVLLGLLLSLLMHPRALGLLRHLPGKVGKAFVDTALPSAKAMLCIYAYYVLFWAAFGVAFVGFVAALHLLPPGVAVPIGASMSLSFAVGFVAVFAPGGVGVRESALYFLLLPYMPAPACILIAVSSRLWIMAGEAISLGLVLTFVRPRTGPRKV